MRHPISVTFLVLALGFPAILTAVTLIKTNDVSITGNISSVSIRAGLVKINQKGCMTTCPLTALTAESQELVTLWQADKNFRRKSNLNVTFRPGYTDAYSNVVGTITDPFTRIERETTIGTKTRTTCIYNIALKNESDTPFKNLTVDYRIFFTQRLTSENIGRYQLAGSIHRDNLAPQTSVNFKTTPFLSKIMYRQAAGIQWRGHPPSSVANILGILLRIRKPGLSEEWIEQEIEHGKIPRKRDRTDFQKIYE